ncbi:MAG: MBL fold metallo-hydrolase [Desulfitobacteriaceae bacterium]
MRIQLFRHATVILTLNGKRILIDPMLSPQGTMTPVQDSANEKANPLVELPVDPSTLLDVDAILLTHTHRDHFDDLAKELIPKNMLIFCQPEDNAKLENFGFQDVRPISHSDIWAGIRLIRTYGQHGTGEIGRKMAPVSGFVLETDSEPSLYIAGDTIWCPEVAEALKAYHPQTILLNGGAAEFLTGGPITMTAQDIAQVSFHAPEAKIIVVHMEAFNHCFLTRQALRSYLDEKGLTSKVQVPNDGELVTI